METAAALVVVCCGASGCGRFSFDMIDRDGRDGSSEPDGASSSPWTAPDFAFRRLVTVDHAAGTTSLTDYPVVVTLDTATLITAGNMTASCADLLVTPVDSSVRAPHWIESGCNTAVTKVWVEVSSIPNSSAGAKLWAYYGDPGATSTSNGLAVFPAFDDFETGDLSRWTVTVVGAVPTSASASDKHSGVYAWAKGPSVCPSNCFSNYTVTLTWNPPLSLPAGIWRTEYWRREPRDWGGVFFPAAALAGDAGPSSNTYADSGWYRNVIDSMGPIVQYELTEIDLTLQETTYHDDIFVRPYSDPEPTTSVGIEESH